MLEICRRARQTHKSHLVLNARIPDEKERNSKDANQPEWYKIPCSFHRWPSTVLVEEVSTCTGDTKAKKQDKRKSVDRRKSKSAQSDGPRKVSADEGSADKKPSGVVRRLHLSTEGFWDFLFSDRWGETCLLRVVNGEALHNLLAALYLLQRDHDVISYVTLAHFQGQSGIPSCIRLAAAPQRETPEYKPNVEEVLVELDYFCPNPPKYKMRQEANLVHHLYPETERHGDETTTETTARFASDFTSQPTIGATQLLEVSETPQQVGVSPSCGIEIFVRGSRDASDPSQPAGVTSVTDEQSQAGNTPVTESEQSAAGMSGTGFQQQSGSMSGTDTQQASEVLSGTDTQQRCEVLSGTDTQQASEVLSGTDTQQQSGSMSVTGTEQPSESMPVTDTCQPDAVAQQGSCLVPDTTVQPKRKKSSAREENTIAMTPVRFTSRSALDLAQETRGGRLTLGPKPSAVSFADSASQVSLVARGSYSSRGLSRVGSRQSQGPTVSMGSVRYRKISSRSRSATDTSYSTEKPLPMGHLRARARSHSLARRPTTALGFEDEPVFEKRCNIRGMKRPPPHDSCAIPLHMVREPLLLKRQRQRVASMRKSMTAKQGTEPGPSEDMKPEEIPGYPLGPKSESGTEILMDPFLQLLADPKEPQLSPVVTAHLKHKSTMAAKSKKASGKQGSAKTPNAATETHGEEEKKNGKNTTKKDTKDDGPDKKGEGKKKKKKKSPGDKDKEEGDTAGEKSFWDSDFFTDDEEEERFLLNWSLDPKRKQRITDALSAMSTEFLATEPTPSFSNTEASKVKLRKKLRQKQHPQQRVEDPLARKPGARGEQPTKPEAKTGRKQAADRTSWSRSETEIDDDPADSDDAIMTKWDKCPTFTHFFYYLEDERRAPSAPKWRKVRRRLRSLMKSEPKDSDDDLDNDLLEFRRRLECREKAVKDSGSGSENIPGLTAKEQGIVKKVGLRLSDVENWQVSVRLALMDESVPDSHDFRNELLERRKRFCKTIEESKLMIKLHEARLRTLVRSVPPSEKAVHSTSVSRTEKTSKEPAHFLPPLSVETGAEEEGTVESRGREEALGSKAKSSRRPEKVKNKKKESLKGSENQNGLTAADDDLPDTIDENDLFDLMGFQEHFDPRKLKNSYSFERVFAHRRANDRTYDKALHKYRKPFVKLVEAVEEEPAPEKPKGKQKKDKPATKPEEPQLPKKDQKKKTDQPPKEEKRRFIVDTTKAQPLSKTDEAKKAEEVAVEEKGKKKKKSSPKLKKPSMPVQEKKQQKQQQQQQQQEQEQQPPPTRFEPETPMVLGKLKDFEFLKYRDYIPSPVGQKQSLPRPMTVEEICERLLQAMEVFIVRKERATTTRQFQSKVSVTFTRRRLRSQDKELLSDGQKIVAGVCQTLHETEPQHSTGLVPW